jgi:hypothetical protein
MCSRSLGRPIRCDLKPIHSTNLRREPLREWCAEHDEVTTDARQCAGGDERGAIAPYEITAFSRTVRVNVRGPAFDRPTMRRWLRGLNSLSWHRCTSISKCRDFCATARYRRDNLNSSSCVPTIEPVLQALAVAFPHSIPETARQLEGTRLRTDLSALSIAFCAVSQDHAVCTQRGPAVQPALERQCERFDFDGV